MAHEISRLVKLVKFVLNCFVVVHFRCKVLVKNFTVSCIHDIDFNIGLRHHFINFVLVIDFFDGAVHSVLHFVHFHIYQLAQRTTYVFE